MDVCRNLTIWHDYTHIGINLYIGVAIECRIAYNDKLERDVDLEYLSRNTSGPIKRCLLVVVL